MRRSNPRILLGLLILAFAIGDVLWIYVGDAIEDPNRIASLAVIAMIYGFFFAELNLICLYTALTVGPWVTRLPWSLFLTVCMYFLFMITSSLDAWDQDFEEAAMATVLLMVTQAGTQILLECGPRIFGWRLVSAAKMNVRCHATDRQYSLKQLFIGISLLAGALSVVRLVLPLERLDVDTLLSIDRDLWLGVATIWVCNLLVVTPAVWAAFQRRSHFGVRAILWVTLVACLSTAEAFVFVRIDGMSWPDGDTILLLLAMNCSQGLIVLGVMLLFRRVGYRLVRISQADFKGRLRRAAGMDLIGVAEVARLWPGEKGNRCDRCDEATSRRRDG